MSSTAKNTIVVIIVIIIVIALFFVFRGSMSPSDTLNSGNATTTQQGVTTGGNTSGGTTNGTAVTDTTATSLVNDDNALNTILASSAIRVPTTGTEVALTKGNSDFVNGSTKGHVALGRVLAKVPTNDGYDVFTDLALTNNTSSSSIHYVALFKVTGSSVKYSSAVVVGDRLTIQSVSPKADASVKMTDPQSIMNSQLGYILTINYLDRKNGEPITATPTLQKSVEVHVKNSVVSK